MADTDHTVSPPARVTVTRRRGYAIFELGAGPRPTAGPAVTIAELLRLAYPEHPDPELQSRPPPA